MSERKVTKRRRLRLVVLGAATVIAAGLILDSLAYEYFGATALRGMDYFFVGLGGLFLVAALIFAKIRLKLAAAFLAAVLAELVLEVVLVIASPAAERSWPWYVWPPNHSVLTNPPKLVGVTPPGEFTTNSRGIRGPEFSDRDRVRILCVGGSTTECMYLDDSKAWPQVLCDLLAEQTPGVWVGNVGRSGLTAPDHATLFEHLPEAGLAEYWLVLCGGNDLGHRVRGRFDRHASHSFGRTFVHRRPGLSFPLRRPFHRNLYLHYLLEDLRTRLRVVFKTGRADAIVYQDLRGDWIDLRRKLREPGTAKLPAEELPRWLDEYEEALMRMIRRARREGKTLVFATQPVLWADQMSEENVALCLGSQNRQGEWFSLAELARGVDLYNQRTRDVCKREKVRYVDLAKLLPKSTEVFYDDLHFNESGARLVARRLAEAIGPMVRGESQPAP